MLLSLPVDLEPFLIRCLNLTKVTPESRLCCPLGFKCPALAVTFPVNVRLLHGLAGTLDIAQITNEKGSCKEPNESLEI